MKHVYCLCKIHGTSAHVSFSRSRDPGKRLLLFSGGAKHDQFAALFDQQSLLEGFERLNNVDDVTVYGEAYGGNMQGMSGTYGKKLRFVAFDVLFHKKTWLNVPNAEDVSRRLGLEFVDYALVPATIDEVNAQRDRDSTQAVRNGMGAGHRREGVVIRPPIELVKSNGDRLIAKHKNEEFSERLSKRDTKVETDEEALKVLTKADEIAREWVTNERVSHVIDRIAAEIGQQPGIEMTGRVLCDVVDDILREGRGEIEWSPQASRAVRTVAREIFHRGIKRVVDA